MDKHIKLANYLLDIKAFHFSFDPLYTWASGIKSPVYTDNRKIISFPLVRNFVIDFFIDKIQENFPQTQYIAGVATGAIPYASIIADRLNLPLVYVRPKAKDHGLKSQVEGFIPQEANVLVIEDLISTAGSSMKAVEALRAEGAKVAGLLAVFTYGLDSAKQNIAKTKITVQTLTDFETVLEQARKRNYLTQQQVDFILQWRKQL